MSPYPTKPVGPAIAPVATAPGTKVTLGDVGLEPGSLDRSIDPCVDFYQFACGGWIANHEIPAERARWGRVEQIEERNRAALQALLDDAAKGASADAGTRKLGDFYAACLDEAAIERAGAAPLKPLLERTTRVGRDARSWLAAIARLHGHGAWVVWRADTAPSPKSPGTYAVHLQASTRDVDPKQHDALRAHAEKLLAFAGRPKPDVGAADVVAIESELAKLGGGTEAVVDARQLARQTRAIDWRTYWKQLGVTPGKQLVVAAPQLFAGIDRLRTRFKPAQWASYFTYHAVAHAFARPFEPAPRTTQCLAATQRALGDLLGQQYAGTHFLGTAKQPSAQLVDALVRAIADELARAEWLADSTRQAALAKLGRLDRAIGYSERPVSADFAVKRDDFAGNVLRAGASVTKQRLARAGQPVVRGEWQQPAFAATPDYDPRANFLTVPAGALQPPLFGPERAIAANLGGLGVAVARELVGGFDARGSAWDVDGKPVSWWSQADHASYLKRAQCVATQFSTFEAMPKTFVDGKRTLAENVADHAGVKIAFKAYRALRKDAAKLYVADGYTEDQQFFIAVGQAMCTRDRPEEVAARLQRDTFAPPKFRVYGALRNMREFAEAFQCAPGTPMNPAKTCAVW